MATTELIGLAITAAQALIFYTIMAAVLWKVFAIERQIRELKNLLEQVRFLLERRSGP